MFKRSLDVHHRDGDKTNNDPDNLSTVCATCHRELEGFLHQFDGDADKAEGMLERLVRTLF
ncbi:MAG: HNH endonuclease signature motif containing protein [Planctomycetota bacterium]